MGGHGVRRLDQVGYCRVMIKLAARDETAN
jgi:hypothetical protein